MSRSGSLQTPTIPGVPAGLVLQSQPSALGLPLPLLLLPGLLLCLPFQYCFLRSVLPTLTVLCFGPLPLVSWLLTDVCIQGLLNHFQPSGKLPPLAVCSGMHNQFFCADSNSIPRFCRLETAGLSYVPFSLPSVSWSSSVSISWDSL